MLNQKYWNRLYTGGKICEYGPTTQKIIDTHIALKTSNISRRYTNTFNITLLRKLFCIGKFNIQINTAKNTYIALHATINRLESF
jgi:hypothetical protein